MTICLHTGCGSFHSAMAELSSCDGDCMAIKTYNFSYLLAKSLLKVAEVESVVFPSWLYVTGFAFLIITGRPY